MKASSTLVPVEAVCWSEGGQACNQTVCGQDTLDLHLEPWSDKQFPTTAGARRTDCKFVYPSGNSIYSIVIHEHYSLESFPTGSRSPSHRCCNATCTTESFSD
ncbi:hypothetical protein TNCV_3840711 [Trichonephila clavipes]|nr:hypothetical protein TNCV_3840711 [Trichonephila clavipes]